MHNIKAVGTRFEVFKGIALTTKSGLLKSNTVWYNNCVITAKEYEKELRMEKMKKYEIEKLQKRKEQSEQVYNAEGPFIRPRIRKRYTN